jgi:hypothetical protein
VYAATGAAPKSMMIAIAVEIRVVRIDVVTDFMEES